MKSKFVTAAIAAAGTLVFSQTAQAVPTITSPYVHKGEAGVEVKGAYNIDDDEDDAWEAETTGVYGITDYWQVEAGFAGRDEDDDEDAEVSALIIENKFQLATPGQLWIDPGLKIEYERNFQGGVDELEASLLLAKQIGKFSNIANLSAGREVGEDSESDLGYGFSYGLSYEQSETFQYGLEWYSDFGDFEDDFDDQGHQVGPVVYGEAFGLFGYEAGVLLGVSESAPDATFKFVTEYEF